MESSRARSTPAIAEPTGVKKAERPRSQLVYRLVPLVLILIGLALWEWAVSSGHLVALFFPAPSTTATTLVHLFVRDDLSLDVGITLYRMVSGILIGGTAGILLGMVMGWDKRARTLAEPFVAGLHPIPKSALLPLLLVLLGIGERPRLTLVALAAFFPLLINTMNSVRSIEPAYLETAANYGARRLQLFRHVVVPASLPGILSGGRIAVNSAMTLTITAELLTSHDGLGARIWMAWETLFTENLYATLLVIAMIGLLINWLMSLLTRRLMPWSPMNADQR